MSALGVPLSAPSAEPALSRLKRARPEPADAPAASPLAAVAAAQKLEDDAPNWWEPALVAALAAAPAATSAARRDATVFLPSLPSQITEALLFELCSQFGPVVRIALALAPSASSSLPPSASPSSFAHVEFASVQSALYAVRAASGIPLFGQSLQVLRASVRPLREAARGHVMVRGLHACVDEAALEDVFGCAAGGLIDANVVRDGGGSKGFGFVVFATLAQALVAITATHGMQLCGRSLFVSLARRSLPEGDGSAVAQAAADGASKQPLFVLRRRAARVPEGGSCGNAMADAEAFADDMAELVVGPDLVAKLRREAAAAAAWRVEAGIRRMLDMEAQGAAAVAAAAAAMGASDEGEGCH